MFSSEISCNLLPQLDPLTCYWVMGSSCPHHWTVSTILSSVLYVRYRSFCLASYLSFRCNPGTDFTKWLGLVTLAAIREIPFVTATKHLSLVRVHLIFQSCDRTNVYIYMNNCMLYVCEIWRLYVSITVTCCNCYFYIENPVLVKTIT